MKVKFKLNEVNFSSSFIFRRLEDKKFIVENLREQPAEIISFSVETENRAKMDQVNGKKVFQKVCGPNEKNILKVLEKEYFAHPEWEQDEEIQAQFRKGLNISIFAEKPFKETVTTDSQIREDGWIDFLSSFYFSDKGIFSGISETLVLSGKLRSPDGERWLKEFFQSLPFGKSTKELLDWKEVSLWKLELDYGI